MSEPVDLEEAQRICRVGGPDMPTGRWHVETPTYPVAEYVEHMLAQVYDVSDYELVNAPTRREAVASFVRQKVRDQDSYCGRRRRDGLSPYTGVRARSDDELRDETRDAGPPERTPDWCDTCDLPVEQHGAPIVWRWCEGDDSPLTGEDILWGWFAMCEREDR